MLFPNFLSLLDLNFHCFSVILSVASSFLNSTFQVSSEFRTILSISFELVMNENSPGRTSLLSPNRVGIAFLNSDTSTIPNGCNDLTVNNFNSQSAD